ncbi:MAG: cell wall metabolism sensor histidine kinase WalK, partial [Anaerolineales bacterium]|nr:cell wall metabolism sensor histidine kinase WalK [Anaerolineales bacterium]
VSPGVHTRLLDEGGAVILGVPFPEGQDPVQVPPSEDPGFVPAAELIQRPEIQSALAGKADTSIREIESLGGRRVLYAAAPVFGENGQVINLVYLATPLPTRGLPGNLTLQLVGAVVIAGIFASLIGLLLARGIASPLEKLDRAVSAISGGDLSQKVPSSGNIRELGNLGHSFNKMTDNLRASDQAKTAFIADVTHELRTPLTVIKGTVETLEDGALDDQAGRGKLLQSMNKETYRLIRLVNDLLILTRSDARALSLDIKPFDLEDLVLVRCETIKPLAEKKGVQFNLDLEESPSRAEYKVLGDQNRVAQVLDNLLDNALRYAPDNSQVKISLKNRKEQVHCTVSDEGPGIPMEHLPMIFERFYRADKARDRESGGAGLGLSIARALIEAQGGIIQAESQAGEGTKITFQLPSGKLPK